MNTASAAKGSTGLYACLPFLPQQWTRVPTSIHLLPPIRQDLQVSQVWFRQDGHHCAFKLGGNRVGKAWGHCLLPFQTTHWWLEPKWPGGGIYHNPFFHKPQLVSTYQVTQTNLPKGGAPSPPKENVRNRVPLFLHTRGVPQQDSPNAFTQRNPPTSLNRQAALAAFLFSKTVVEVAGPRTGILSIPCVALVALRLTGHNLDAKHWASSQHPIRIRAHWHLLDPLHWLPPP